MANRVPGTEFGSADGGSIGLATGRRGPARRAYRDVIASASR
jgi:hypothetical protein